MAKTIMSKLSESIGEAIGFPDSTQVQWAHMGENSTIEVSVRLQSGDVKVFHIKVIEKR